MSNETLTPEQLSIQSCEHIQDGFESQDRSLSSTKSESRGLVSLHVDTESQRDGVESIRYSFHIRSAQCAVMMTYSDGDIKNGQAMCLPGWSYTFDNVQITGKVGFDVRNRRFIIVDETNNIIRITPRVKKLVHFIRLGLMR